MILLLPSSYSIRYNTGMADRPFIPTSRWNTRRRRLGMTHTALAARSGVAEPTVKRILGGRGGGASFANVAAIAAALGVTVRFGESDPDDMRREQAHKKAERIARMVQATSALEAQAVDAKTFRRLVERTRRELLTGPRRRLWSE